jgi:hypothetical protein
MKSSWMSSEAAVSTSLFPLLRKVNICIELDESRYQYHYEMVKTQILTSSCWASSFSAKSNLHVPFNQGEGA